VKGDRDVFELNLCLLSMRSVDSVPRGLPTASPTASMVAWFGSYLRDLKELYRLKAGHIENC
jgi:hypothetical protein